MAKPHDQTVVSLSHSNLPTTSTAGGKSSCSGEIKLSNTKEQRLPDSERVLNTTTTANGSNYFTSIK